MSKLDNDYVEKDSAFRPDTGVDPFNPPDSLTGLILEREEEGKPNSSVILDLFYDKLNSMSETNLTENERETKEKLKELLDYMSRMRVVDAPVLSEIYELYRYKL